jgi:protein-disulfide isomerase
MKQKTLFVVSAALLVLAFVAAALLYNIQQSDKTAQAAERNKSILVRMHSPTLGKVDARVHIVEFFDPACETCRSFYPFVKGLMAADPERIRLSIRYAPFHDGSDYVVKILEAARKQGRYWEALEAILASQPYWAPNHVPQPQLVWRQLGGIGLNLDQVRSEMNAPEIANLIEQDIRDARTLNVTKTPEFFVNGRPMPSFGYEQLKQLVEDALATAYR